MSPFRSAVVLACAVAVFETTRSSGEPPARPAKPVQTWDDTGLKAKPGDNDLRKLLVERHNALLRFVTRSEKVHLIGAVGPVEYDGFMGNLFDAVRRLADARYELSDDPSAQVAAYERAAETATRIETAVNNRATGGLSRPQMTDLAKAFRLDMEIRLLKVKRSAGVRD